MTGMNSRSVITTQVYAQDTQPSDTRDGVMWVDTSVSPRDTYVYSSDSASWEAVTPDATQAIAEQFGYTEVVRISGTTAKTVETNEVCDAIKLRSGDDGGYYKHATCYDSAGNIIEDFTILGSSHTINFPQQTVSKVDVNQDQNTMDAWVEMHRVTMPSHSHQL